MNLLNLLIVFFCLLVGVFACLPPNDHIDHDYLSRVRQSQNETEHHRRWFSVHGSSGPFGLWPRDKQLGYTRVLFCFADQNSKDRLIEILASAWTLWDEALGKFRTGHGFLFQQYVPTKRGASEFCYVPGSNNEEPNPEVPDGTVVVEYTKDFTATTVGYNSQKTGPLRHTLYFDTAIATEPDKRISHFAHEIGHMMGLLHEHQRVDRDYYVEFKCHNLPDYDDIQRRLQGGDTMFQVCTEIEIAYKYGARAVDYLIVPTLFQGAMGSQYDFKSIMHYESKGDVKRGNDDNDPNQCAISKKVKTGEKWKLELLPFNKVPSAQDVEVVKKLYPPPS